MSATLIGLKLSLNTYPTHRKIPDLPNPRQPSLSNLLPYSLRRLPSTQFLSRMSPSVAKRGSTPPIMAEFSEALNKSSENCIKRGRRIAHHAVVVLSLMVALGSTKTGICKPVFAREVKRSRWDVLRKNLFSKLGIDVSPALRGLSMNTLYSGALALDNLLGMKKVMIDPRSLRNLEEQFRKLLDETLKGNPQLGNPQLLELQRVASRLEIVRDEDKAVHMLREAYEKAMSLQGINKSYAELARELDMMLVEMLIYQGKYKEAWLRSCLNDELSTSFPNEEEVSDGRGPFYKAILCIMLKRRREEAQRFWNQFKMGGKRPRWPGKPLEIDSKGSKWKLVEQMTFEDFENAVNLLKEDIDMDRAK
ncbi:hypothetical protein AMTRI_Chr03g47840 [Amborella trichopoda]|uniref:Uncharacterized protein n=1 Tax=Amborella trichopoda TaxID=13333 RepID=W1P4C0_AMBTC|nr:uncharacterized protein LOC110006926 [Amborella trichopoda]ERN02431.1 hypothetical protein AMTR_s00096p00153270 [Amborella trichopoda]|eukprot:XP_020520684.1 uncharacterized protein LOC110006926 [Amborella trichopoda]